MAVRYQGGQAVPNKASSEKAQAASELFLEVKGLLSKTPTLIIKARKLGPGWTEKAAQIDRLLIALQNDINKVF
jgi:hypothetical protein